MDEGGARLGLSCEGYLRKRPLHLQGSSLCFHIPFPRLGAGAPASTVAGSSGHGHAALLTKVDEAREEISEEAAPFEKERKEIGDEARELAAPTSRASPSPRALASAARTFFYSEEKENFEINSCVCSSLYLIISVQT